MPLMPRAKDAMFDFVAPLTNRIADLERLTSGMHVSEIPEVGDPILRNELITHGYWRLASRAYAVLDGNDLVWPTYGSWASAQAGVYMRLGRSAFGRLASFGAGRKVTSLLGRGNQLIFRDIALPFTRFLDLVEGSTRSELRWILAASSPRDWLAERLELDRRSVFDVPGGEAFMVFAFEQYLRALMEDDADARSERIFVANACVGLQEQARVDCIIDDLLESEAINRSAMLASRALLGASRTGRLAGKVAAPVVKPVWGEQLRPVKRRLENIERLLGTVVVERHPSRVIGTRLFMELKLGDDHVDLSDGVGPQSFAPGLETIDLKSRDFREAFETVMRWDLTPDSTEGTAVVDWSSLDQRMNFIIDLFRVHQGRTELRRHPLLEDD
jgi:hypothetical protein